MCFFLCSLFVCHILKSDSIFIYQTFGKDEIESTEGACKLFFTQYRIRTKQLSTVIMFDHFRIFLDDLFLRYNNLYEYGILFHHSHNSYSEKKHNNFADRGNENFGSFSPSLKITMKLQYKTNRVAKNKNKLSNPLSKDD